MSNSPHLLRQAVGADEWVAHARQLGAGEGTLTGLWGEADSVHMAILDDASGAIAISTLPCPIGQFPSVARHHPAAMRLERSIADLFGLSPDDAPDARPWLDHGKWGVRHPLANTPTTEFDTAPYPFLPSQGEGLHQIPVGPVHAGIIEPGHFRFTANGETVVRLEERLGYVHKGIEALMIGADIERGAQLAGRISGDSTVAYALAFSRAAENACGIEAPPRAQFLRALLAELERIANHFGDIGAICNDASFPLIQAHCAVLREQTLRSVDSCFGHRLARDCIVPGGVIGDLDSGGIALLRDFIGKARPKFARIVEVYDNTASLQDRTAGTGIVTPDLARRFGAGGYIGRASGRAFDARRAMPYPPYDSISFVVPVLDAGDVNARVWIRIREIEQSLLLIERMLDAIPAGPVRNDIALCGGEALSLVEGFRGDILVYVRLDERGRIARCHLRDPSWFQWPLLEAAIEGNIVADFPLCNKSFNCSYSGQDL
jgi:Ni,Fe-hydrogenase III large subunit